MSYLDTDAPVDLSLAMAETHEVEESQKRWPTYDGAELDRSKFMTASEAGKCSRELVFTKTDPNPRGPLTRWGYAKRGTVLEAWMAQAIARGLPSEWELQHFDADQVSLWREYQSGTPDGFLYNKKTEELWVVEFKTLDPRANFNYLPKDGHYKQLQQNIYLAHACYPTTDVVGGVLFYMDASDFQRQRIYWYDYDIPTAAALMNKASSVMRAIDPAEFETEGLFIKDGCKYCNYTEQCSALVQLSSGVRDEIRNSEKAEDDVFK